MLLRRSVDQNTRDKQSSCNMSYAMVGRQLLQQPDDHAASVHFESTETAQKGLQRLQIPDLPDSTFEAAAGRHGFIDYEDCLTADHRRHGGCGRLQPIVPQQQTPCRIVECFVTSRLDAPLYQAAIPWVCSATIYIYTSTAVVHGCSEMSWPVPKAPGATRAKCGRTSRM